MARLDAEQSGDMSQEGERVRSRRDRLGMSITDLAEEAGVSRDTLSAIEHGQGFRRSSLTKIERVLDQIEEEMGYNAPPLPEEQAPSSRVVIVRIKNDLGEVVVEGPVDDLEALQLNAVRALRALTENPDI